MVALNDDRSHFKNREGDLVEITPLRAGGSATGYIEAPSEVEYVKARLTWGGEPFPFIPNSCANPICFQNCYSPFWISPTYAMAASSAAADSSSLHQPGWASMALAATNFDLGYHVDGWSYGWVKGDEGTAAKNGQWAVCGLPLIARLTQLVVTTPQSTVIDAKRYKLTDGGHFEHTGIYALIRRGVRLIIASDAGEDPGFNEWCKKVDRSRWHLDGRVPGEELSGTFHDLRRLDYRLRADFGTHIEWNWDELCEEDPPRGFVDRPPLHVMTGFIRNLPVDDGPDWVRIIYIKAGYDHERHLLKRDVFIDSQKHAAAEFPQDSTLDQWYTEQQVLAYRALAEHQMSKVYDELFCACRDGIEEACNLARPQGVKGDPGCDRPTNEAPYRPVRERRVRASVVEPRPPAMTEVHRSAASRAHEEMTW